MTLTTGTRLGPYEIVAAVGKGGMGEVYRAKDTKLDRDVAIKTLPEAFAADADRLARFEREAKTLAALNHPNIAHVYGLEAGALVMEFVDGEDLSQQIARGPIALDAALAVARQIAAALEAAHEQGIVHRDLKPANVKVRADDTVKVLDFGLAKALGADGLTAEADSMNSPTLTARATLIGVILGTAAYMAPEQARGKPVDRRADIWAFGVVLFEMLTGRRAFDGDEVSDVLASVLKTEPDWNLLPSDLPPPVRRLLHRCLEKDPKRRLRDISEGILQLDEGLSAAQTIDASARVEAAALPAETAPNQPFWRRALPLAATAVVTALAVWALTVLRTPPPASPGVVRFRYVPPLSAPLLETPGGRDIAIAPNGRAVVYLARPSPTSPSQLYLRLADQLDATPLRGGENAVNPFVSPDGQWIGFVENTTDTMSGSRIKKVSILGGPATVVVQLNANVRGATWLTDGSIVAGTAGGLKRISAAGVVSDVTGPDRLIEWHVSPSAVSGSTIVLFTILSVGGTGPAKIGLVDLANGRMVKLPIEGASPRYASTGHIIYATSDGSLAAVSFDLKRLAVTNPPAIMLEGVGVKASGASSFDLSANGHLVFGGGSFGAERSLVWVDRAGHETSIDAPPRPYVYPRVSREGRILLGVRDPGSHIWILDNRGALNRLTANKELVEDYGVWTPDGRRVIFMVGIGRSAGIFSTRADGIGEPELLLSQPRAFPNVVTSDGKTLIFRGVQGDSTRAEGFDILALSLTGDRKVTKLVATDKNEGNAALSSDNQWLAYQSDQSGRMEIYVRPFPNVNAGQTLISTSGGTEPLWAPDGREIFYRSPDNKLMSVAVTAGRELVSEKPKLLFDTASYYTLIGRNYDISPDGKRFVMIKLPSTATQSAITFVLNWTEELKRTK